MIKSFTITNHLGDSMVLDIRKPAETGFLIKSVTGLGPASATINTTDAATTDGATFNSARLSTRNIVFNLVFVESDNNETIEELRQKTYKYFPSKKKIGIKIRTDNRFVECSGYVETNEPEIFSSEEGSQISILCTDPYLYAATGTEIVKLSSVEAAFEFPFTNDSLTESLLSFGEIKSASDCVVNYVGDSDIGMKIHILVHGDATNMGVYNTETGECININTVNIETITGAALKANDEIIINTNKGSKGLTLKRGTKTYNILNCLDRNSTWLYLSKGDNLFMFVAETGLANLEFSIEHSIIYDGV